MTNQQHQITPPPELVQQWVAEIWHEGTPVRVSLSDEHIATLAAQWGADQELEACCEWLKAYDYDEVGRQLAEVMHAARRPKPPSLKQVALLAIDVAVADERLSADVADVVRRALEQLDD
jgi:hypothetical protein